MFLKLFRLFFPSEDDRLKRRANKTLNTFAGLVAEINELFDSFENLSDSEIRERSLALKARLEPLRDDEKALDAALEEILPEAFALVKQACKRLCGKSWEAGGNIIDWNMVPYDVQLAGGVELFRANIAEMATGEGKTLVAVLPLYLNALTGKGAHLVTVNDYLARRDREWMGPVYEFLGLSIGCILTDMTPAQRRESYAADVTYGTNNEFGFDYLRDNMAMSADHLVQRPHFYAIVDEVDSVLIDEARTPLIISGQVDRSIAQFTDLRPYVAELVRLQNSKVNQYVADAERLLAEADSADEKEARDLTYEAGIHLLRARKGFPKHNRLSKIMNDAETQRLVQRVEDDFMRDKRVGELEEDLYFVVDEKGHGIDLTQQGREAISPNDPDLFLVPDIVEAIAEIESEEGLSPEEIEKKKEQSRVAHEHKVDTIHCMSQLLRAFTLYEKDVEYVVQENKVIIVDEFTGRLMNGRRWSDGLHQAVEAKENVKVESETQTLATITLQNYFRMYRRLAGMTGTAVSEEGEFAHTYKMDVAIIPTNQKIRRVDDDDLIYKSQREKYNAIIDHVREVNESGMPVLIGTVSVEVSEKLSRLLQRAKISHSVLNAKQHEREAQIVREAGLLGAVTIATNMAGRGTDIKLGPGVVRCRAEGWDGKCCFACPKLDEGDQEVDEDMMPCGLHIVGTERHEARRIDRQLRGRSGRQGDPGYSIFFISLEDDLMRKFASERMANLMSKGFEEGEAMKHGIATRAISSAQKKIEDIHFENRKRTLEYDDVMNKQRTAIYGLRRRILLGEEPIEDILFELVLEALTDEWPAFAGDNPESRDIAGFFDWIRRHVPMIELDDLENASANDDLDAWLDQIMERVRASYQKKIEFFDHAFASEPKDDAPDDTRPGGKKIVDMLSRSVMLHVIDSNWRDHLLSVDEMKEGIHWQGVGQRNPLDEYRKEATYLYMELTYEIHKRAFEHAFRATLTAEPKRRTTGISYKKADAAAEAQRQAQAAQRAQQTQQAGSSETGPDGAPIPKLPRKQATYRRDKPKVGPNDPCPCGSGRKFKKCHGAPGAKSRAPVA